MSQTSNAAALSRILRNVGDWVRVRVQKVLPTRLQSRIGPSDIIQEAWASILQRLSTLLRRDDQSGVRRMLLAVARLKAAAAVRRHTQQRRNVFQEATGPQPEIPDRGLDPCEAAIQAERYSRLLSQLSASEREILELHVQGLTADEIAKGTQRPRVTVYRIINRIVRALIQGDDEEGDEHVANG